MPMHIAGQSRREFLATTAAGVFVVGSASEKSTEVDGRIVYLLNDTHIGEKQPPDSPVPSHLRMVVSEILRRKQRPVAVIINGDLALRDGQPGDYEHFSRLIAPLAEGGVDVHLTLGNHDNREAFYGVLSERRPPREIVESKYVSVVRTPLVNFFLLDTLRETMVTQGTIGAEQLTWLTESLDNESDKPAIVVAHHNPRLGGDPLHFPGGLVDSQELWRALAGRVHVKAYLHGHVHDRTIAAHRGIHIVNTPATSYVGNPRTSTTGWTIAHFTDTGVRLTTRTTDPTHRWNGQVRTLRWRT